MTKVPNRAARLIPQSFRAWTGSILVLLGTVFILLALNEGQPYPHQQVIDTLFHSWFFMGALTACVWLARRGTFGPLPWMIRMWSGLLLVPLALFTMLDIVLWPGSWFVLRPFGIAQSELQAQALVGVSLIWGAGVITFGVLGLWRSFRNRYEHHGVAVGFGPLYFYFRRRRAPYRTS